MTARHTAGWRYSLDWRLAPRLRLCTLGRPLRSGKRDDDEEEIRGVEKEKSLVANRITLIELNCYYIYKDEEVDDN